jgi:hypothetical protein
MTYLPVREHDQSKWQSVWPAAMQSLRATHPWKRGNSHQPPTMTAMSAAITRTGKTAEGASGSLGIWILSKPPDDPALRAAGQRRVGRQHFVTRLPLEWDAMAD